MLEHYIYYTCRYWCINFIPLSGHLRLSVFHVMLCFFVLQCCVGGGPVHSKGPPGIAIILV
jgi:hypothetical protein